MPGSASKRFFVRGYALVWILIWLAARPPCARAQAAGNEVTVTGDAVSGSAFEVLAGAFGRAGIRLTRAERAPACAGTLTEPSVSARVWISWNPTASAAPLELCFQDRCQSSQRTLGPFAKLDARAREELITVVESGLAALTPDCPQPPRLEPERIAAPELAADSGKEVLRAPAVAAPSRAVQTSRAAEPGSRSQPAPHAAPDAPAQPPGASPTAAEGASTPAPTRAAPAATRAATPLLIGASYGLALWADAVLAHNITAMAAYAVHRLPVYVGIEFGYTPRFRAQSEQLAIDASCIRIALQFSARIPLTERWSIDAQLGPAVEWLRLAPAASTRPLLIASSSTAHADPLLFLRVGPALRVYAGLLVGLEVQMDTTWIQRSYGFVGMDGPETVVTPNRWRLSVALNTRAEI